MPLPLAIPFALACGMSLAWLARSELARSEVPLLFARPFVVALGLGMIVLAPIMGYFAALHGDWAYLYVVRASRVPSAVDLLFVVLVGAAVPSGFAIAAPWAIAKRGARVTRAVAILLGILLACAAVSARRLSVSATYAQFHGNFGVVAASRAELGRGVLASWVALALGLGWSAWVLRRGAKADSSP